MCAMKTISRKTPKPKGKNARSKNSASYTSYEKDVPMFGQLSCQMHPIWKEKQANELILKNARMRNKDESNAVELERLHSYVKEYSSVDRHPAFSLHNFKSSHSHLDSSAPVSAMHELLANDSALLTLSSEAAKLAASENSKWCGTLSNGLFVVTPQILRNGAVDMSSVDRLCEMAVSVADSKATKSHETPLAVIGTLSRCVKRYVDFISRKYHPNMLVKDARAQYQQQKAQKAHATADDDLFSKLCVNAADKGNTSQNYVQNLNDAMKIPASIFAPIRDDVAASDTNKHFVDGCLVLGIAKEDAVRVTVPQLVAIMHHNVQVMLCDEEATLHDLDFDTEVLTARCLTEFSALGGQHTTGARAAPQTDDMHNLALKLQETAEIARANASSVMRADTTHIHDVSVAGLGALVACKWKYDHDNVHSALTPALREITSRRYAAQRLAMCRAWMYTLPHVARVCGPMAHGNKRLTSTTTTLASAAVTAAAYCSAGKEPCAAAAWFAPTKQDGLSLHKVESGLMLHRWHTLKRLQNSREGIADAADRVLRGIEAPKINVVGANSNKSVPKYLAETDKHSMSKDLREGIEKLVQKETGDTDPPPVTTEITQQPVVATEDVVVLPLNTYAANLANSRFD